MLLYDLYSIYWLVWTEGLDKVGSGGLKDRKATAVREAKREDFQQLTLGLLYSTQVHYGHAPCSFLNALPVQSRISLAVRRLKCSLCRMATKHNKQRLGSIYRQNSTCTFEA